EPGHIRLLPIEGKRCHELEISRAAIALHGFFFGLPRFTDIFPSLPKLRWIHIAAAGIDDFASPKFNRSGVWVTNVSGAYAAAMTEYTIAGMVLMTRHFKLWIDSHREHRWPDRRGTSGNELRGKQVGIIGYGGVGRH